jgi:hypothetical protein
MPLGGEAGGGGAVGVVGGAGVVGDAGVADGAGLAAPPLGFRPPLIRSTRSIPTPTR